MQLPSVSTDLMPRYAHAAGGRRADKGEGSAAVRRRVALGAGGGIAAVLLATMLGRTWSRVAALSSGLARLGGLSAVFAGWRAGCSCIATDAARGADARSRIYRRCGWR